MCYIILGRAQLLPVRSTAEGLARYVGKYISKHVRQRDKADSGARRVRYINFKPGERVANSHFQFVTEATATWRRGLAKFARSNGFRNMEEIKEAHGPRWCYWLQDAILGYADLTISEEQAEWARRHRLKLLDRTRPGYLRSTSNTQQKGDTLAGSPPPSNHGHRQRG